MIQHQTTYGRREKEQYSVPELKFRKTVLNNIDLASKVLKKDANRRNSEDQTLAFTQTFVRGMDHSQYKSLYLSLIDLFDVDVGFYTSSSVNVNNSAQRVAFLNTFTEAYLKKYCSDINFDCIQSSLIKLKSD